MGWFQDPRSVEFFGQDHNCHNKFQNDFDVGYFEVVSFDHKNLANGRSVGFSTKGCATRDANPHFGGKDKR